ncbi:unnamed protein product, partial [Brenthis ino]
MAIAIYFLLASTASLVKGVNFMPCYLCEPKPFSEALDVASMRLLWEVYESSDDKNVLISPLGVFTLLSLYVSNVKGQVADEIVDFLAAANNTQASMKTKGKINNIVSEDDITYDLIVALYNVIYFKGHWDVPFNENFTREKCFLTDDFQLIKKPMMNLLQSMYYYEDEEAGFRMIQLPYKESKLKMVVVLPSHLDGLSMVLRQLSATGLLRYVNRMNHSEIEINLDLPRFEIKSKYDLQNVLSKVGISSIFHESVYGIVNEFPVSVDKVFQEAFITVDEKGSTAGQVTGLHIVPFSALPHAIPFKVDRPFLFAILYDDIVLFAGTFSH